MKSVYEIMDESDSCLLDFDKACDELILSKLIIADKKISNLLQIIAGSKILYELIEVCLKKFDFNTEFLKSQKNADGRDFIVLPQKSRKKQIAYTFCLLYAFDTKKMNLQDFISTYFSIGSNKKNSDTVGRQFSNFCSEIIYPFRKNVGIEFLGEEGDIPYSLKNTADVKKAPVNESESSNKNTEKNESEYDKKVSEYNKKLAADENKSYFDSYFESGTQNIKNPPQVFGYSQDISELENLRASTSSEIRDISGREHSKEIEKKKEKINFEFGANEKFGGSSDPGLDEISKKSLLVCIREIIGIVAREPNLVTIEREEMMIICEAFEKAVEYGGISSIRIMYIGLKNTIRCSSISRSLQMQYDDLERLIEEYEI